MKIILIIICLVIFLSCMNNTGKKNNADTLYGPVRHMDTSFTPLLEIGSYYVCEIGKDSLAGLLLGRVRQEEDSVYYTFIISGRFFKTIPSEKEFREAGLWGMRVPNSSTNEFLFLLNNFFISEKNLLPQIGRLKYIGKINFSNKNTSGSLAGISSFTELSGEYELAKKRNEDTDKMLKRSGIPVSQYLVLDWKQLITTNKKEELSKPEVVWVLSPRTAHPAAAGLMKEEWWWSPIDDLSPFGNDDGSDAFYTFKDWRETNPGIEPVFCLAEVEKSWGMSFSHIEKEEENDLLEIEKKNEYYRDVDRAIIGVAMGQVVLEGAISPKLKALAIKAINRTNTDFGMNGMPDENKIEYRERLIKMKNVLHKF